MIPASFKVLLASTLNSAVWQFKVYVAFYSLHNNLDYYSILFWKKMKNWDKFLWHVSSIRTSSDWVCLRWCANGGNVSQNPFSYYSYIIAFKTVLDTYICIYKFIYCYPIVSYEIQNSIIYNSIVNDIFGFHNIL